MTESATAFVLEARECCVRKGRRTILSLTHFAARQHERIAVIGPRGAGKTTMVRMLAGACDPDSGAIMIDGVERSGARSLVQRRIAYAPAGDCAFAGLSPPAALTFEAEVRGPSRAAVDAALARFQLDAARETPIAKLPFGAARRFALARLHIADAAIVICDDPTAGLDPADLSTHRAHLRDLAADRTLIFSTNRLDDVEALASRAVVLRDGAVIADASVSALKSRFGDLDAAFAAVVATPGRAPS